MNEFIEEAHKQITADRQKDYLETRKCIICGRNALETVLNDEGCIHHHTYLKCLDRQECERYKRKQNKKLKKKKETNNESCDYRQSKIYKPKTF